MSDAPAILTSGLSKRYDSQLAVDRLDLRVEQGEIFGFLGPNGAGKSTTIRMLLDLIRPTTGNAQVMGFDCQHQSREVRGLTGYLPGDLRLYGGLRGSEMVELFAKLRSQPTAPESESGHSSPPVRKHKTCMAAARAKTFQATTHRRAGV